jgi:hypothetical protein
MKRLKLPASIRWAFANCLLIWTAMTLYRGALVVVFGGSFFAKTSAFFSGMLVDAGVISFVLLIFVLMSLNPMMHPYKSKTGKAFGYLYFIFWALFIGLAYALDVAFLKAIHFRVYGSKILNLASDEEQADIFFKHISVFPLLLALMMIVWVWGILIRWLHGYLGKMARTHSKTKRLSWQAGVILACSVIAVISFSYAFPLNFNDLDLKAFPVKAIASNPVLNFFFA